MKTRMVSCEVNTLLKLSLLVLGVNQLNIDNNEILEKQFHRLTFSVKFNLIYR